MLGVPAKGEMRIADHQGKETMGVPATESKMRGTAAQQSPGGGVRTLFIALHLKKGEVFGLWTRTVGAKDLVLLSLSSSLEDAASRALQ